MKLEPVPLPVDAHDPAFANIAAARRHYASLSPERRKQLEREWETDHG